MHGNSDGSQTLNAMAWIHGYPATPIVFNESMDDQGSAFESANLPPASAAAFAALFAEQARMHRTHGG